MKPMTLKLQRLSLAGTFQSPAKNPHTFGRKSVKFLHMHAHTRTKIFQSDLFILTSLLAGQC